MDDFIDVRDIRFTGNDIHMIAPIPLPVKSASITPAADLTLTPPDDQSDEPRVLKNYKCAPQGDLLTYTFFLPLVRHSGQSMPSE